jgi:hypothetical protein
VKREFAAGTLPELQVRFFLRGSVDAKIALSSH